MVGRLTTDRRGHTAITITIAVAVLAGCTQAPPPTGTSTSLATSTAASTLGPSESPTAPSNSASTAPAVPSTSAKPTSPVPPEGPGGCATSALVITVERGSGAAGHQFAYLQFKNSSQKTCSLTGFTCVVLLKGSAQLGVPATRSAKSVTRVSLLPGAGATAVLSNDSTCNAENSDSVQIIPPNRNEKIVLPLRLRGCPLTIDPVAAS
jgi:hypothetical protein